MKNRNDKKHINEEQSTFTPINTLCISVRTYSSLTRAGVHSVEKLQTMTNEELMSIRNFGRKTLEEVRKELSKCPVLLKGGCLLYVLNGRTDLF